MGWERRGNKGRMVYYRKVRVGRKVKSVYCGSGERGRTAEREDLGRRQALSLEKPPSVTPTEPESQSDIRPTEERESVRELFERAVGPRGNTSGVLQGATPEASEGATPQAVEKTPDTARPPEPDWSRFLPLKPRKYRTWRS